MKNSYWKMGPLAAGLFIGLSGGILHAQPTGDAKGENPPNQQQGQGGRRGNRPQLTPEQRQQMMQQMQQQRELMMRRMLTENGFTDKAVQDAVVDFINEQGQARMTLQDKTRRIAESVRDEAVTDAQLATLLTEWRAAIQAEKTRREDALKALDAEIGYTKKPRLDAFLSLSGIIGDEASLAGGPGGGRRGGGGGA